MPTRRKAEAATTADDPGTQLATRIPKTLQRRVRVFCVESEVSIMEFVVAAIREKVSGVKTGATGRRRTKRRAS